MNPKRMGATRTRLARARASAEEAGFHQAMLDPSDDTARLVYADWLEDHGRPGPAARIRHWIKVKQGVVVSFPTRDIQPNFAGYQVSSAPDGWLSRLIRGHVVTTLFDVDHPHRDAVRRAAALSELHSYGLLSSSSLKRGVDEVRRQLYGRANGGSVESLMFVLRNPTSSGPNLSMTAMHLGHAVATAKHGPPTIHNHGAYWDTNDSYRHAANQALSGIASYAASNPPPAE